MGMLDRLLPTAAADQWRPPPPGECRCELHIDQLLDHHVPLADGSRPVSVAELVASGVLSTAPTPHALWVEGATGTERRGPFHWRVVHGRDLDRFLGVDAPTRLDDALFVQPGVDRVLWLDDRSVLAIGAPALCMRGVQASVVRALLNPRVRLNED